MARHAGNWTYNLYSVGIEHEGYISDPSWFTDAMYRSSAALNSYLCDKYGIPKDRNHIIGHNEVPGATHTDPGPYWDWDNYIYLVNGTGSTTIRGDIVGYIRENDFYDSSAGITGATLTLHKGANTSTDSSGIYTFYELSPGTYTITASAPGYLTACETKDVVPRIMDWKSIALPPIPLPLVEMDVQIESIQYQNRDIFQDLSSWGILDLFKEKTVEQKVMLTNSGSLDAENLPVGIWREKHYLKPISYSVSTNYPDGSDIPDSSMNDSSNLSPESPPSNFDHYIGTLHEVEMKSIGFKLRGDMSNIGHLDHPDLRAWVNHIDNNYEKGDFFSDYNNLGGYQTFKGGDLRDYSEFNGWEYRYVWRWDSIYELPSLEGWSEGNSISYMVNDLEEGTLILEIDGDDPYIYNSPLRISCGSFKTLKIRLRHESGSERGEIFYIYDDNRTWNERKSIDYYSPVDGEFHEVVIDISHLYRPSTITNIRLDPPHKDGSTSRVEIDYVVFSIDPPSGNDTENKDAEAGCSCSNPTGQSTYPFVSIILLYTILVLSLIGIRSFYENRT